MKQRISYLDSLRGFAIFLVVFGHILQGKAFPVMQPIHEFIYSFHMPLFMFLSGLFAYKAEDAAFGGFLLSFLKKKCVQLLWPCLVWSFLMSIYKNESYWNDVVLTGGLHYWFLFLLFLFFSIVAVVVKIKVHMQKSYNYLAFVVALSFPFLFVAMVDDSSILAMILNKQRFLFNYPFFMLAFFIGRNLDLINRMMSPLTGAICGVLAFAIYICKINSIWGGGRAFRIFDYNGFIVYL